ncbi:MOGS [Mytilus edulis]|uniref:Mannosyl-oligosaccharide glucosidase n=1 Tax=Mytilus edulis TaxID=6550 RepID=A0A8S3Q5D5_MYTED|nr:MOGS [Mytilus edulis]
MSKHSEMRRRNNPDRTHDPKIKINDLKHKSKSKQSFTKPSNVATIFLMVIVISGIGYWRYQTMLKEVVKMPLEVRKINNDNSTSAAVNPERFWGSYRPNLYFGMKTRSPQSPLFGFMWLTQFAREMPPPVRHWCDQGDSLQKYGWLKHDGVNFGIQELEERTYKIRTEFVKRLGGQHGGDWTARISVTPKGSAKETVVSLMFYVALDGQGTLQQDLVKKRLSAVTGSSEELGDFSLSFSKQKGPNSAKYNHLISYVSRLDKITDLVKNAFQVKAWDKEHTLPFFALGGRLVPRESPGGPNMMVYQVTVQVPSEIEIVFESGSFVNRPNTLSGDIFQQELTKYSTAFDKRFTKTFDLEEKGYNSADIDFAKAAMSNMVGGIGYFYGSSVVQSRYNDKPIEYWPAALYTAVPSRSFFPRGFLWDEGFHNLLISRWDSTISKDILSHWFDLINIEGWIPREQILGDEARARVPVEFVVQHNENANPPTLFLPLQRLVSEMKGSTDPKDKHFLESIFPRLKTWFDWYNSTQRGSQPLTYRWRGRDFNPKHELNPKTLTSGLDDFPRASHPTVDERHVDLRCWIALASGILADIADAVGKDSSEYKATYAVLSDSKLLQTLHWWPQKQRFADYGLHTDKISLVKPKPPANVHPNNVPPMQKERMVKAEPTYQFVNAFGYVSLFPFLLKFVDPNSVQLFKILGDLKNPDLLWTNFGLRSLARTAPLYNKHNTEHDPPYWRGAIWINMNYLTLGALNHYSKTEGQYQKLAKGIYTELRNNIVSNIIKEYRRTGYIWEQYDDKSGNGKGSHPFTGWSALVVLIMAEEY